MVDGSLGKQIPVGETSVELAMPGNLTKDLGRAGTDARDFAAVLQGSMQSAKDKETSALPLMHVPVMHVEDSLSDSISASLAVALSGVGVTAEPIRQLPASDPQTASIAASPAGMHQQSAPAESAVSFPLPTSSVGLETNPALSIPTPRSSDSDPRVESNVASLAAVNQQLAHAESAVGFPLPTSQEGAEANPVLSIQAPRSSDPQAENIAVIAKDGARQSAHAEPAMSFPIPASPVVDQTHPAFSMGSTRPPASDATASARLDPVSLPLETSAEIQPAAADAHSVAPVIQTANPSDMLPRKAELAWSLQDKANNDSPRTAVSPQIPRLNMLSKESAQNLAQPNAESLNWITFTTERAQAGSPVASSATTIPPHTQNTVTPPDTKVEDTSAPTLPIQSAMKILVQLEPSALPAHSAPITETQSGPRDAAVSNRLPEPKPITPAPEPIAVAPQINQHISEEASRKPNVGTGQSPQFSDSSDATTPLVPALIPVLSETPKVTPPPAEIATVQVTAVQQGKALTPNTPMPESAAGAAKSNTASKTAATNSGQAPVRIEPFGGTPASGQASQTDPARPVPRPMPVKDSARNSNMHSQNPDKEQVTGNSSSASPNLTTAEREAAAQASAHISADSAPDTAKAAAIPAPAGKTGSVDTPAQTRAADQPAEPPMPSPGLEVWNGGDNAQTRLVQSARLASNPDRSEMRVALEADRLGTVELQAKVTNDQIRAAIAVDRHDTHAMLASDLSALHQALNDRQIGTAHVTLYQGTLASNDAFGNGTLAGRREASPQANENTRWAGGESSPTVVRGAESPLQNNIFDSNGRLSVRA